MELTVTNFTCHAPHCSAEPAGSLNCVVNVLKLTGRTARARPGHVTPYGNKPGADCNLRQWRLKHVVDQMDGQRAIQSTKAARFIVTRDSCDNSLHCHSHESRMETLRGHHEPIRSSAASRFAAATSRADPTAGEHGREGAAAARL